MRIKVWCRKHRCAVGNMGEDSIAPTFALDPESDEGWWKLDLSELWCDGMNHEDPTADGAEPCDRNWIVEVDMQGSGPRP